MRGEPVDVAGRLVAERFPGARAAWLGGSVVSGRATAASDLDLTVLLEGRPAPYRHSVLVEQWPVELFVHTERSLAHYCEQDRARRQPTMLRLVAESWVLVDRDGSGARLRQQLAARVAEGPAALTDEELASSRYAVSDLLSDLGGAEDAELVAVASQLWQRAADLLLTVDRHWTGTGKGLARELRAYDAAHGTAYADDLVAGLRAALGGDVSPLVGVCERILEPHGGRLFDGHRLGGSGPC